MSLAIKFKIVVTLHTPSGGRVVWSSTLLDYFPDERKIEEFIDEAVEDYPNASRKLNPPSAQIEKIYIKE